MKKIILIFIVLQCVVFNVYGEAPSITNIIDGQLDALNINEINKYAEELNSSYPQYFDKMSLRSIIDSLMKGEGVNLYQAIPKAIGAIFLDEMIQNTTLLSKIIILAIICAMLQNISAEFENKSISQAAFYICFISTVVLLFNSFKSIMAIGATTIADMTDFMNAIMPTLFITILANVNNAGITLLRPLIFSSITIISNIIADVVIPLIQLTFVLTIVNHLSDKVQISKLRDLLRQVTLGIMGLTTTIFIGVITIQNIFFTSFNGLASQTAKFALDKFVPVIGGFLSEAYDLVYNCSVLIKNGVGIFGLLILFSIVLIPVIKIATLFFVYKLAAALTQPLIDNKIADLLTETSSTIFMMLVALICVVIMFVISITIIMSAGNNTIMMR